MFGWRARIGYLCPSVFEMIAYDFYRIEQAGEVELEDRFSDAVAKQLTQDGYDVKIRGGWEFAFGGVEAVFVHPNQTVLMGAADPRREGYAVGH